MVTDDDGIVLESEKREGNPSFLCRCVGSRTATACTHRHRDTEGRRDGMGGGSRATCCPTHASAIWCSRMHILFHRTGSQRNQLFQAPPSFLPSGASFDSIDYKTLLDKRQLCSKHFKDSCAPVVQRVPACILSALTSVCYHSRSWCFSVRNNRSSLFLPHRILVRQS